MTHGNLRQKIINKISFFFQEYHLRRIGAAWGEKKKKIHHAI